MHKKSNKVITKACFIQNIIVTLQREHESQRNKGTTFIKRIRQNTITYKTKIQLC